VWESTVDGRQLRFRLAGINNQNFIMRDEETGSWWQQITGEAILGPLKGKKLKGVFHDELTFATWKGEEPAGRVLKPDERLLTARKYAPANWEDRMVNVPVATQTFDSSLPQRELIVGIKVNGAAKAYPVRLLKEQNPIVDKVGGQPVIVVLEKDGRSVRAFATKVVDRELEFFAKADSEKLRLVDAQTGSEWDFAGTALSGPLAGQRLTPIYALLDYWFDWKTYNQNTTIYALESR
jgi:hypothetical protein